MIKIFISVCFFAAALGASIPIDESNIQEHIVGGKNTSISQVPYQVALYVNGNFMCGGSIVSPTFIVTAAHCLMYLKAISISIRAGSSDAYKGGVMIKAKSIKSHILFSENTVDYDVGIVELVTPLQFNNNIKAITLATAEPPAKSNVLVSGWGVLSETGPKAPTLQSVTIPTVNRSLCARQMAEFARITPRMMCAGVEGKAACFGDSGGPLVYNGQLLGIVSFGVGCARKDLPGVYANVANPEINSFIRRYTKI